MPPGTWDFHRDQGTADQLNDGMHEPSPALLHPRP